VISIDDERFIYDEPFKYLPENIRIKKDELLDEFHRLEQILGYSEVNERIEEILIELKELEKEILMIYPVTVRSYLGFHSCINCLLLEKNREPDIRILKMSYLDYLFELQTRSVENKIFLQWLEYLMFLVFKCKSLDFYYDKNKKIFFKINDIVLNSNDFDNIKDIILKQNGIEHEENIIDFEFEKALKEAQKYKEKHEDKPANLEERIISYHSFNGYDYEKIYNLTIRKFNKGLQRMCMKTDYEVHKAAEISGMVKFKDSVNHWLSHVEPKQKFEGLVVKDADSTINQIKSALE
jgi:hypothetical protein